MAQDKVRHPPGLYVLFGTEAAERFSFYAMKSILILYLTKALGYQDDDALIILGLYAMTVYLAGVPGGYLSDKILGARKSIILGGIVMGIGQMVLMRPEWLIYGMALIVAGNGFFKPNISTIVSGLYEEGDNRRDGAFTIFYMGINLGAFVAPMLAGYFSEHNQWRWIFASAGIAMAISLTIFLLGQRTLGKAGFVPGQLVTEDTRLSAKDWRDIFTWVAVLSVSAVLVVMAWKYVGPVWRELHWIVRVLIGAALVAAGVFGVRLRDRAKKVERESLSGDEWRRIFAICFLSFFVIFFWMGFEQAGGSLTLFADRSTNREIFGWTIPAAAFQSVNAILIIVLAIPMARVWSWNDSKARGLSTPTKMALGLFMLALGFVVMIFAQARVDNGAQVYFVWLLLVYFLHTVGELCLSPIGLSMVTKLSPARTISLMMGVWFACTAMSEYLAQYIVTFCSANNLPLWQTLMVLAVGAGGIVLVFTPVLKRWMQGRG